MKKLAILALGVLSLVACTDQKLVAYNKGKVTYTEEYVSLEKEAKKWEREKSQQQ